MNNALFECGIRYEKTIEDSTNKRVTELYVVSGVSFGDAETRIIEEMSPYIEGEFTVSTIKRANYTEIFRTDDTSAEYWFKCKINFITLNEKTGKEKKTGCYMLVQAASTEDAGVRLHENMKGTVSDYQIASVAETNVYDVYLNDMK